MTSRLDSFGTISVNKEYPSTKNVVLCRVGSKMGIVSTAERETAFSAINPLLSVEVNT
jgi:hypothetical protein